MEATTGYLQQFVAHLRAIPHAPLTRAERFHCHEHAAQVGHSLRTRWSGVREACGMEEVVAAHERHWGLRNSWKEWQRSKYHSPRPGELLVHVDFKEHDKLPFGPVETGKCVYANYLLGVGVFWLLDLVSARSQA